MFTTLYALEINLSTNLFILFIFYDKIELGDFMRISAKSRYALLSMTYLGSKYGNDSYISIIEISQKFNISKIYLEQVFSLLKKADLILSTKGSSGGYRLQRKPIDISIFDILNVTESSLFEKAESTIDSNSLYEKAVTEIVYENIDSLIQNNLKSISLETLVLRSSTSEDNFMFYI